MKDIINVAVIGCGNIANSAHIPAYIESPHAKVKYFCDIIPERADAAVEKYGCGKAVYDYKEILADPELDAVSVCTHNNLHSVISIDFMRAGKDVLCEKPAARVLSEALEMEKVSRETDRILSIGVCNRYSLAVNKIKELIEDGVLGEVYHVYASFRAYRSIPGIGGPFTTFAEAGGGSLIDWGVHYLDLIEYVLGDPKPVTVSGEAFSKLGRDIPNYRFTNMWAMQDYDPNGTFDVDDSVTGIIRTQGPVISFNGAWAENIDEGGTFIDFMGTKGGIRHDYCGSFTLFTEMNGMLMSSTPSFRMNNMHRDEVLGFVESVREHKRNRNDISNAVITSRIMQGVYDSSAKHREVEV